MLGHDIVMLSILELCDRYSISRNQVYERRGFLKRQGVDVTFVKQGNKSFALDNLVEIFDNQNKWLLEGGSLNTFTPSTKVTVMPDHDSVISPVAQPELRIAPESIQAIALAVAEVLKPLIPPPDFTWKIEGLRAAARFGYQLSSSQLQTLIGVKPRVHLSENMFERGSFKFYKVGKIGRENAWIVGNSEKTIQDIS